MKPLQFQLGDLFRVVTLIASLLAIVLCAVNSGGCGSQSNTVVHMEFSPDGEQLLIELSSVRYDSFHTKSWQCETTLEVFLLRLDDRSKTIIESHTERGYWLRGNSGFASRGEEVATAIGAGGRVRYWNIDARNWDSGVHACDIDSEYFRFSPTGGVAAVIKETAVEVKDTTTGETICSLPSTFSHAKFPHIVFAEQSDVVALGRGEYVELRDIYTGALLNVWTAAPHYHYGLSDLSTNGDKLLFCASDGLYLCRADSDEPIKIVEAYYRVEAAGTSVTIKSVTGDNTLDAKFSPDGRVIAAVGEYGGQIFDAEHGKPVSDPFTDEWTNNVVFTPDGRTLISSNSEGDLDIWDAKSLQRIRKIRLPGKFRTPWTVPLLFITIWIVACWKSFAKRRRRLQSCTSG